MFYDRFVELCSQKGVTPSRAAVEAGLSKSTVTKWKQSSDAIPSGTVLKKLAAYFGKSVAEIMDLQQEGESDDSKNSRKISFHAFTYAMQNEAKDLTDMDKQILLSMAKQLNDASKQKDGASQ